METFLRELDVRSLWSVSGTALPIKAYFFQVLKLMIDFRAERLGAVERASCFSGRGSLEMGPLGHWPRKKSSLPQSGKDVLSQRSQRCDKEPQSREKINDRFQYSI